MAACFFAFAVAITFIVPEATTGRTRGYFPLKSCLDDVNMLSLIDDEDKDVPEHSFTLFAEQFEKLTSGMNGSRLLVAQVTNHFSTHNVSTDVGKWSFETFYFYKEPYKNWRISNLQKEHNEIETVLEDKIQIVNRLFNEMRGVRHTAINVGVIFLDANRYNFSKKEILKVPIILQQQRPSDVRIFVVVIRDALLHMTDAVVIPTSTFKGNAEILLMAICNQCFKNGIRFEHSLGTNFLSCYTLQDLQLKSIVSAYKVYWTGSAVAAKIESAEEMIFLQDILPTFIKHYIRLHNDLGDDIHINLGLYRNLGNYAKRFEWTEYAELSLPMVIPHWLTNKPSGGHERKNCVIWTFRNIRSSDRKYNGTTRNISNNESSFDEGWQDISCETKIAVLSLFEVALPKNVENVYNISRAPASNESFEKALRKGDFLSFKGNIVSMSENVANTDFLQFLKTNNKDFPVFDCEDAAFGQRFISYAWVCDGIDHCLNRRDEIPCETALKMFKTYNLIQGRCASGQVLLHKGMKCDNIKDCADGSDENDCTNHRCKNIRCCDGSCLPLQWANDGEFDCPVCHNDLCFPDDESSIHNIYLKEGTNCALICNVNKCVHLSQLNDGNIDCKGPEGPLDERIGALDPANTCNNSVGYIWAPKCVYVLDRYGGTIGCRDMSHLRDCENFQCGEGYVKCQNSYCIPLHYVLDGKADCPTGDDEQSFYIGPCIGNFACWNSTVCPHPDLVCDGLADCPHKDDELGCQVCPEGFRCIGGTVTVTDYNTSNLQNVSKCPLDEQTKYLDLSMVDSKILETFINVCIIEFSNMHVLKLSNCNITTFYSALSSDKAFSTPFYFRKIDISYNLIREIFNDSFYSVMYANINHLNVSFNANLTSIKNLKFRFLETIDLSHTGLSYLSESVFVDLPNLKHLNLSHTLISDFKGRYFPAAFTLQTLDLRGTRIVNVHAVLFHDLTVSHNLYVDLLQICCPQIRGPKIPSHACPQIRGLTTPSHVCQVPVDPISSCFDMLTLPVQRVLLWLLAVLAVLGNMAVIVYRVIWDRSVLKRGYGLFVINLAVSDFIMGVYMFIVASADYIFRDTYVLNENKWKQSGACKFAGFMATLSSEASTFFISLITLDRFLVIKFPFGEKKLSQIVKIASVSLSWFTCVSLSLIPLVFNMEIYSTNAMCLGLPLTSTHVKGWEYSVGIFIIFNFFMFLCIAYGQCAIFCAMSENRMSRTANNMPCSRRAEDITVAKHLSLVVLTDFLFWFPVGLMGLMSLGGHDVSDEVYSWTTVLLLPVNSAVNPVLYTVPAIMKTWEKFKNGV